MRISRKPADGGKASTMTSAIATSMACRPEGVGATPGVCCTPGWQSQCRLPSLRLESTW
jgi:hypothetical protein